MAAERDLNRVLRRHIRAQPHVRQQADALDETLGVLLGAGDHQPTRPVARDPVGLRQPVEGQVSTSGATDAIAMCFGVVVEDLVVDLVGQQQQLVLAREIGHLL